MIRSRRLADFVERRGGGADDQLFGGSKRTPRMSARIAIRTEAGVNEYKFTLAHGHPDRLIFTEEAFRFSREAYGSQASWQYLGSSHREAMIVEAAQGAMPSPVNQRTASTIVHLLKNCSAYQFHDTSDTSYFKKEWRADDNWQIRSDGGNLAAVLYRLEQEDVRRYEEICLHIGRVLPGFDRFVIEERYGKVLLRWQAKWSDKTFGAHITSDGSLRFFALVTLLNLPSAMLPHVMLLDEPELGLHPAAIGLVGDLIKRLSKERQVIVATQSPLLVDAFRLDEIVVLDLLDGRTECRRIEDPGEYERWLDDFTPGQLWQKNLLGGRP